MGWCHEFGPQINEGCGHPMEAGATSCTCVKCGVECTGRFDGCASVWARGPVQVIIEPPDPQQRPSGRRRRGPIASAIAGAEAAPPAASPTPPLPTPLRPMPVPSAGTPAPTEVMDWLRSTFDGLWGELQALNQSIAKHDAALSRLGASGDQEGLQSLHEIAQSLNERVENAVAASLAAATANAGSVRLDTALGQIRGSLSQVEESAAGLISALEENFGDEFADVADDIRDAIRDATAEAEQLAEAE